MSDRRLIFAGVFLRAAATGLTGVLVGVYLARLGHGPGTIGLIVGVGLAGATAATLLATARGDRIGRRRLLAALAAASGGFGLVVAAASDAWVIGAAAFLGMLNGMGRDRGAALVLEQAALPSTTTDHGRTAAFAWYNVLQDAGGALGALAAGIPALIVAATASSELAALRLALALAALLMLAAALLYPRLSAAVESPAPAARHEITRETRGILWRISALFALDGLGGGFLTAALVSYFFFERFGTPEAVLGLLFFGARVLNALSHLGAAWLARRIGLVNTMVWTHIPSSLLLASVAVAPSFPVAALLFLLREGLVEMDVPTRQSYVMAVVRPAERTFASGVTHLVRMGVWTIGAPLAGALMQGLSLAAPLVTASAMKITYDLLLWRAFRNLRPPEERKAA